MYQEKVSSHKLLVSETKIKDYQRILETTLCHWTRWNRLYEKSNLLRLTTRSRKYDF